MTPEQDAALRAPFPAEVVGKLPKTTCRDCAKSDRKVCSEHTKAKCPRCGNYLTTQHIDLDYVGHAEVTDRLLTVDKEWTWEPAGVYETGEPVLSNAGTGLWIKMTVCGVTRMGYGDVEKMKAGNGKELISDAIRNAAMRFGVALYLWSKNELESSLVEVVEEAPAPRRFDCKLACGVEPMLAEDAKDHMLWEHGWVLDATTGKAVPPPPPPAEPAAAGPPTTAPAPPSDDPGRPFAEAPVG